MKIQTKALVVFSGGQDSTTCLGAAIEKYSEVEAISFFYGQKHSVELEQSKLICDKLNINHTLVDISFLSNLVDSALTNTAVNGDVNQSHPRIRHLPASFVPNRNAVLLTLAHAYAQKINATVLITGTCETDYSGYPDCRRIFIDNLQNTLNLGSFGEEGLTDGITIETPLMYLDKADTFKLAKDVGVLDTVINDSHTCYEGDRSKVHEWGSGCGQCPACKLRENGWREYLKRYGND